MIPITYRSASVLCQSDWPCLHKTVNMLVFFFLNDENTYPKGYHLKRDTFNGKLDLSSVMKPGYGSYS